MCGKFILDFLFFTSSMVQKLLSAVIFCSYLFIVLTEKAIQQLLANALKSECTFEIVEL